MFGFDIVTGIDNVFIDKIFVEIGDDINTYTVAVGKTFGEKMFFIEIYTKMRFAQMSNGDTVATYDVAISVVVDNKIVYSKKDMNKEVVQSASVYADEIEQIIW